MSKIIENYILNDVIGEGQYGKVYKATHKKQEGALFAVKTIKVDKFKQVPQLNQFTINEIQTLEKVKHVNIVGFVEMLRSTNNVYLVYEFCQGGTLEDKMKKLNINNQPKGIQVNNGHKPIQQHVGIKNNNFFMNESNSLLFFVQLVKAFHILASKNILHRDIKPQNILFDSQDNVKLADFGFCKTLPNKNSMTRTMVGSPIYMAPELLKGQPYNTKADIWSLGVVLFEMIFGYCPFEDKTIALLIQKINTSKLQLPLQRNQITKDCQQLLYSLLTQDPRQRIDWNQLMNLPFLKPYFEQAKLKEQQHIQFQQQLQEKEQQKNNQQPQQQQQQQQQQKPQTQPQTQTQNQQQTTQQNKTQPQNQNQQQPLQKQNSQQQPQQEKENNTPVLQEITQKVQQQQQQTTQQQQQQPLQDNKDINNINNNTVNIQNNINIKTSEKQETEILKPPKKQQFLLPDNINQIRSQILYQIRVTNELVQNDFHPLAPIIGYISLINIKQQSEKNKFIFSKEEVLKFQEIIKFYQNECLQLCETNTLYKHDNEFKQIVQNLNSLNQSEQENISYQQQFQNSLPYYRKKALEYVEYLQKNNKIEKKQLLVHLNEVLDCLLIEKLYKNPNEAENNENIHTNQTNNTENQKQDKTQQMILNENLSQHENQYLQELLDNKIQFAQVLKIN